MRNVHRVLLAVAAVASLPLMASAQYYSDTFNSSADASNYNVYQTTGASSGNTSTAVFGYNYSALGIPAAPSNGLTDTGTTALRVQSDDTIATTSAVIGAISVVTKGLVLPSTYSVSVEVWGNYVGGTTIGDANGSNSSTGAAVGIGALGTSYDSATSNATQGGVLLDAVRDATSSGGTYRVYASGNNYGNPPASGMYAAGNDTTASMYTTTDGTAPGFYKDIFPSVAAPTAQSTAASTQTGMTVAGEFGFAWHNETFTQTGTSVLWYIDGNLIATVADSLATAGGSQIALGDQDSNTSTGPTTYNFDLYENLVVTPEPASLSMLGLGAMSLLARRRK
jgi:hypothetical protein